MKITKGLLLFGVLVVVASSCFDPPEYPNTPSINLAGLDFFQEADAIDSLVLSINFKDGDGDLGLSSSIEDISYPFHPKNYYLENNGNLIAVPTITKYTNIPPILLVNAGQTGKLATNRTLDKPEYAGKMPEYIYPYTCNTYIFDTLYVERGNEYTFDATYNITDTLRSSNPQENPDLFEIKEIFYTQKNPDYDNITVDFILSNGTELDWETITGTECGPSFDGRFPRLSDETGPLEGTLRYSMKSEGIAIILGSQSFKLRVTIKDRALNSSNTIETAFVTLEEIKK